MSDKKAYEAARRRAHARGEKEVSPEVYEALAQEFKERRKKKDKEKAHELPDYFASAHSVEDNIMRSIKGNFRRKLISASLLSKGLASIPPDWYAHSLSEELKRFLTSQGGPQARGGEDLPDLAQGEVEIARLSLNSVHGEVTSLRAKRESNDSSILLSMVDEEGTIFELLKHKIAVSLSGEEVLAIFRDADPSPTDTSCEFEFSSFFYPDLDSLAIEMGIVTSEEGEQ